DPRSLADFCEGCRVVVNCAGPSSVIGDRVARAAFAAGADYVDVAGERALHAQAVGLPAGRTALPGAGMMPGLSELLPRVLAHDHPRRTAHLRAWCGGRGRFT